ncbi:MAG: aminoacyl-tRNA hydrolase [Chloroflexi bacterium]|nr:aminoacyl-tRNA hydrolase [Chloroflexota bacterium]
MKLIVGLGNPGRDYANNRHNVGFKCIDAFAREYGISLTQRGARSKLGTGEIENIRVILAKPQTFMNLSGEAVAALMRRYRLSPQDILVVYDDLDLPLGKIRIREKGSSGGHKGIRSIIEHIGSQDFARVRIGIAPSRGIDSAAAPEVDAVEHVLSDFAPAEKTVMQEVYPRVAAVIHCMFTEGIAAAMNKYN